MSTEQQNPKDFFLEHQISLSGKSYESMVVGLKAISEAVIEKNEEVKKLKSELVTLLTEVHQIFNHHLNQLQDNNSVVVRNVDKSKNALEQFTLSLQKKVGDSLTTLKDGHLCLDKLQNMINNTIIQNTITEASMDRMEILSTTISKDTIGKVHSLQNSLKNNQKQQGEFMTKLRTQLSLLDDLVDEESEKIIKNQADLKTKTDELAKEINDVKNTVDSINASLIKTIPSSGSLKVFTEELNNSKKNLEKVAQSLKNIGKESKESTILQKDLKTEVVALVNSSYENYNSTSDAELEILKNKVKSKTSQADKEDDHSLEDMEKTLIGLGEKAMIEHYKL